MSRVVIDVDQIEAEIADRTAEVARLREAVERAMAEHQFAEQQLGEARSLLAMLRRFVVEEEGGMQTGRLPTGPMGNIPATEAVENYVRDNPGAAKSVSGVYEALRALGFEGTKNAVQVAMANLYSDGKIERLKRGIYGFPVKYDENEWEVWSSDQIDQIPTDSEDM